MTVKPYHTGPNNQRRPPASEQSHPGGFRWYVLVLQLVALVLVTLVFALFDLDRKLSSLCFDAQKGFYLRHHPIWQWLYRYGTIPGAILTLLALVGWGASYWFGSLKPWRRPCLVVALTAVVAAGLLVNAVLKQYWGRPRPNQTIEFGGYWHYQHICPPGPPGRGSSFPCGHCAMGFVFLSLWGVRRQSKSLAVGGAFTGIGLGVLLSITRVIQGAHFVSDTIWSLGLIVMTTTVLDEILIRRSFPAHPATVQGGRRKTLALVVTVAALVLTTLGFMTRRPYFESNRYGLPVDDKVQQIDIRFNADPVRLKIVYTDQPVAWARLDSRGLGWINADTRVRHQVDTKGTTLVLKLDMTQRSYFNELDHTLTLTLPRTTKDHLEVSLNGQSR